MLRACPLHAAYQTNTNINSTRSHFLVISSRSSCPTDDKFVAVTRSDQKHGWTQHDSLELLIDAKVPGSIIRLSRDSMVLVKPKDGEGLPVARVMEVLEVRLLPFVPPLLLYTVTTLHPILLLSSKCFL